VSQGLQRIRYWPSLHNNKKGSTLLDIFQDPMTSSEKDVIPPTFSPKHFSPKTVMTHFGWNFWSNGVFRRNPSHKNVSKKLAGRRERNFLNFLEYCLKTTTKKSEICIFLNVFKCKVNFFQPHRIDCCFLNPWMSSLTL